MVVRGWRGCSDCADCDRSYPPDFIDPDLTRVHSAKAMDKP
jgi:hypothetical protein